MSRSLRDDAIAIWSAGVAAVDSERLVRDVVRRSGDALAIAGQVFHRADVDRIVVVGGGKAGAGMAAGLEAALGADLVAEKVVGWLNVPADCVRPLSRIQLHPGRPAGVNEPTEAGVEGTTRILELASQLTPRDLCIVLLSGGGSALLPAPIKGITLADKQLVTRELMQSGARIDQLNAVRSCLSRIKGGGLLRTMPAGRCVALIISDVVGDPLSVIASGPTVDVVPDPRAALDILHELLSADAVPASVVRVLNEAAGVDPPAAATDRVPVQNVIIGNNQTAVAAAAVHAQELGYDIAQQTTDQRGIARELGRAFAEDCLRWRSRHASRRGWCLLNGGEPVVQLTPTTKLRKGGRNQELVLAAAERLWNEDLMDVVILSGGTDGEDGPTDAAGAFFDQRVHESAMSQGLQPVSFLAINNSYEFFQATSGLLQTGPTHTNVMDLRVGLVVPAVR